jgi:hypothetical protein
VAFLEVSGSFDQRHQSISWDPMLEECVMPILGPTRGQKRMIGGPQAQEEPTASSPSLTHGVVQEKESIGSGCF